ncbi:hypothetical protein [Micromonospora sp. CPCC 205558]|uniref:hypothetical protein n=1 Tax=Micromonospora sp. CPCC 205558 TaxID=3122403 RepID=UPI002FEEE10F
MLPVGAAVSRLRAGLLLPLLGVVALLGPLPAATTVSAAAPPSPGVSGQVASVAATASAEASPGTSRYYVVGAPQGGQREYLYQIAVQTLGDGNRYREIFELNQGRPQPDGARLTDPLAALQPGWILELPADADGASVQVGPLPTPSVTRSAEPTAGSAGTSATPYLVGAAVLVVAVLFAGGLWLLHSRRRARTPRPTTAPAPVTSPTADTAPADAATSQADTVPNRGNAATSQADTVPNRGDAATSQADTVPNQLDVVVRRVDTPAVVPAQPVSAMGESRRAIVNLESLTGAPPDRLDVRLIGVATGFAAGVPCAWLRDEPLPAATLPFVLGRHGGRRFVADLAATPDILTITGTPSAAHRQARAMAEQLRAAGLMVTVVGDVFGADLPQGCRRVAAFPTAEPDIARLAGPGVIVSAGLSGVELTTARALAARTGHRVVPVLVGEVVRTRWSVRVTEPQP